MGSSWLLPFHTCGWKHLFFSEFLKRRQEPVGLLVLPEEQSGNGCVGITVLVALKEQKMNQGSFCLFRFFELFEKYDGYKTGKLKLKKPEQLQVRGLLWGHAGNMDPSVKQFFWRVKTLKRTAVCRTNAPCLIPHAVHTQLGDGMRAEWKLFLADAKTVGWG